MPHDPKRDVLTRLAGLRPSRRRRRVRLAQFALGAALVTSLGVALPEVRTRQTQGSALVEVLSGGRRSSELRAITKGTQARLVFSKPITDRVSVGDDAVAGIDVPNQREIILLGREIGRTTLTVWFEDETIEQFLVSVQRDLSILETALREVHPNIVAEIAPDRDALVLTGVVPARAHVIEAQKVATSYLAAGEDAQSGKKGHVINQLQCGGGDTAIELVIQDAIHEQLGCTDVRVTRVSELEFLGEADILILMGTVPSQTKLTQVLTLASRVFMQQDLVKRKRDGEVEEIRRVLPSGETETRYRPLRLERFKEDIFVAADESGGLYTDEEPDAGRGLGQLRRSALESRSPDFGSLLQNEVTTNIGRAKVLELAEGRILSFLEVADLPQIRVDIRLYEINRNALLDWNSEFTADVSDFDQPSTIDPSGPDNDPDFQNILSFLEGELANQFNVSGDHVDIEAIFSVLETEGIARSISSPSITVLSGELAAFGVGGQIPIDETTFAGTGVATGSVGFVSFGVSLAVRPLVGDDDYITLDLVPEVSNPDAELTEQISETSGTNPPTTAFAQRVLRTTSRLRDGQSLLIGGLTERSRSDSSGATPWLHQIPVLGWLFKDFTYADADRDLVIVVHPVIVRDQPDNARLWIYPETLDLLAPEARKQEEQAPPGAERAEGE